MNRRNALKAILSIATTMFSVVMVDAVDDHDDDSESSTSDLSYSNGVLMTPCRRFPLGSYPPDRRFVVVINDKNVPQRTLDQFYSAVQFTLGNTSYGNSRVFVRG